MHELIVQRLARPRLHRAPHRWAGRQLRERALQWPPERAAAVCGIAADAGARPGARLRHARKPAAIRLNYGMQRVRGGGNAARADRAACRAWSAPGAHRAGGLLLSSSGWFPARPQRGAAAARPARRPPAAHHQHEHDRRRPAARRASPAFGRDRGARRLQQQPGRGGARVGARWWRASRARTCSPSCSSSSRPTPPTTPTTCCRRPRSSSTGRAHQLRPHRRAAQRAGDRAARRGAAATRRSSASWRARMGFDEPCFADDDETLCAQRLRPARSDFDALRAQRLGQAAAARRAVRRRRLPDARRASASSTAPGLGVPEPGRLPELRAELRAAPAARSALSAGDDLAAGAQLPQLELRQRDEPARHRGRAAARDPRRRRRRARHRRRRSWCASSTTAASTAAAPRSRARARPGVVNGLGIWWRKLGVDGTNVNELTSQRLTDIGRGADLLRLPGRGRAGRRQRSRRADEPAHGGVGLALAAGALLAGCGAACSAGCCRRWATTRSRPAATST